MAKNKIINIIGLIFGLVSFTLADGNSPIETPQANNGPRQSLIKSQIKELAGKVLIDAQTEITQPLQVDKYTNFVTVSTPIATPASGHAFLYSFKGVNQFVAKYSDGSLQVLGGTGGTSSTAWGSITGTLASQTDLQSVLTGLGASTGTLRSDFNTSTATLQSNINAVGVATATLRTAINNVGVSTAALQTSINNVGAATGTIVNTMFPVSLSTGVVGTLPDTSLTSNVALLNSTQTFTATKTFTSSIAVNYTMLANGSAGSSGQLLTSNGNNAAPTWQSAGATNGRVVQSSECVVTTSSSTSSASYVQSNVLCKITPTSSSNKVRVSATCEGHISITGAGTSTYTLLRNGVNLFASNGFSAVQPNFTGTSIRFPISLSPYSDSPASTSQLTYAIGFANNNGATLDMNDLTGTCFMLLEETN